MGTSLWLFLLAITASSASFIIDPDLFFSNPAPADEALAFFKELKKEKNVNGADNLVHLTKRQVPADVTATDDTAAPAPAPAAPEPAPAMQTPVVPPPAPADNSAPLTQTSANTSVPAPVSNNMQTPVLAAPAPLAANARRERRKNKRKERTGNKQNNREERRKAKQAAKQAKKQAAKGAPQSAPPPGPTGPLVKQASGNVLDDALKEAKHQKTLSMLSDGLLNGAEYKLAEAATRGTWTADFKNPECFIDLPGKYLVIKTDGDTNTNDIVVTNTNRDPDFANTAIDITGTAIFNAKLEIPTTISKAVGTEAFSIDTFGVTDKVVGIMDSIELGASTISALIGTDLTIPGFAEIKNELKNIAGYGAFNKEKLQLVIEWTNSHDTGFGLTTFSILFEIRDSEPLKFAIFAQAANLVQFLTTQLNDTFSSFPIAKGILESVDGTGCLFVTKDEMEFLEPIKTNANMEKCFGDQTQPMVKSNFMTVPPGLHLLLSFDITEVFTKYCKLPVNKVKQTIKSIQIYANLSRSGLGVQMLSEVKIPNEYLKQCFEEALAAAPGYLTNGDVVVRYLKIGAQKDFKVGVSIVDVTLPWPETKIKKFDFDIQRSGGTRPVWNIKAKASVNFGSESNADVNFSKQGQTITFSISSDKVTLGDIVTASKIPLPDYIQQPLSVLGVKNFALSYSNAQSKEVFKIQGNPIIFGYDSLQIITHLIKESGSSLKWHVVIHMNGADFDPIMENLFGQTEVSMKWLSGLKAVAIVSSNPEEIELVDSGSPAPKLNSKKKTTTTTTRRPKRSVAANKDLATALKRNSQAATPKTKIEVDGLDAKFTLAQKFTIEYTVTFGVKWVIPVNKAKCYNNKVCEWCVNNLDAGKSFTIKGEFGSRVMKLRAETDFKMEVPGTDKLHFTQIGMTIEIGVSAPKIRIDVKLTYENAAIGATGSNILEFTGGIEATPTSISLVASMKNFIYPTIPDHYNYIGIGDLFIKVGITAAAGLPTISAGAAVRIANFGAKKDNKDYIEVRGAFGIDPSNPQENWVYGSVSSLTVDKVCKAFVLNCDNMSPALKETGFPYGITVSFSGKDRNVVGIPEKIPEGLVIKGTLNIFGYEVKAFLKLTTEEFCMDLQMAPIDWANGLIEVRRTEDAGRNKKKAGKLGPLAKAQFSLTGNKEFTFFIQGYINLFNVLKTEVTINITNTQFIIDVTGYLIPAFLKCHIVIQANYGTGTTETNNAPLFSFEAEVTTDFQDTLIKVIKDFFVNLSKKVAAVQAEAEKVFKAAEEKVRLAKEEVQRWRDEISGWQKSLNAEKTRLQNEEKKHKKPDCVCGKVCFPFLDWNSHCWKVWGYWVGCPFFNSCFKKIPDVICIARCAIENVISTIVRWTKQAILSIGVLILEGVKGLSTLADGVFELANGFIDAARRVTKMIEKSINSALLKGQQWLITMVKKIQIYFVKFSAKLTADYSACASYSYDMEFFDKRITGSGNACLDIKSMSSTLMGAVTEECKETKGTMKAPETIREIESQQGQVNTARDEFEKEQTNTREKQKDKKPPSSITSKKPKGRSDIPMLKEMANQYRDIPKRSNVPTREEMELIHWSTKKLEKYDVRGDPQVRSVTLNSPYGLPDHHPLTGKDATVEYDHTVTGQKRSLDFDSNMNPCERMKRALGGYSDLTNGIMKYSESVQMSQQGMESARSAENEKLENLRRHIEENDMAHNFTVKERNDAYYVYNNLASHQEDLARRSTIALHAEDDHAMPIIRRQINHLLKREKGTNFMEFTDLMHTNAVEGYKRSGIPHPSDDKGEKILANIKQNIQAIVTNEGSPLTPMTSQLQSVKKNIIAMSEYTKQCRGK